MDLSGAELTSMINIYLVINLLLDWQEKRYLCSETLGEQAFGSVLFYTAQFYLAKFDLPFPQEGFVSCIKRLDLLGTVLFWVLLPNTYELTSYGKIFNTLCT